jgi:hypothetical protein
VLHASDRADAVAKLMVIADGLRSAVCRPDDPLSCDRARTMLAASCREVAGPLDDWISPQAHQAMACKQVG